MHIGKVNSRLYSWQSHLHLSRLHKPTLQNQCLIFLHNFPWLGSFFGNFPTPELHVLLMVLFTLFSEVCALRIYFSQTQLQSATEQLSDEQQPASQEQSEHPEFPQLQPIANSAAKTNNVIVFFIKFILSTLVREPQTHGRHPQ